MNNRIRRNIWLTLLVLSGIAIADRILRIAKGSLEWDNLISVIIIFAFCSRFYCSYRNAVKNGNLYGKVNLFRN